MVVGGCRSFLLLVTTVFFLLSIFIRTKQFTD